MKITVRFYAGLECYAVSGQRIEELNIPEPFTIQDLLNQYGIPPGVAGPILVNGQLRLSLEYRLHPGDYIEIHPLFAGG